MREDVFVAKRDGGIGNESARLKRWITVCNDARTCKRVRRRGRASGSWIEESVGREGLRDVLGDVGWLLLCLVRVGDDGTVVGEIAAIVSSPSGTNPRIASSSTPRGESESARDSASPRSNSTS